MSMAELRDQLQTTLGTSYTLQRELGGGGMSRVFVAEDAALGRQVVVKVLPPEMASGVSIERFKREISLAARLQHPHIVPLLSAGETGGLPYFTMPLVSGESLRERLTRTGELPVAEAARLLREVVSALAYAHRKGIVHRDIKPENILLTEDHAVVTDFGVAKALSAATKGDNDPGGLTSVGIALGTPAYMAPEQAAGDPMTDHRADIYALGVVAYELLAGQAPFAGRPAHALIAAHMTEAPQPLDARRPAVPAPLASLVMRCLAKSPADRPQHAEDVLSELDRLPNSPEPQRDAHAIKRGSRRMRTTWIAMGATALAVLGAYAVWETRSLARVVTTPTAAARPSIAVLPMANTSGDPENEHFSDGLTDELIGALGKVSVLAVSGRTSVFALKDKGLSPRAIAESLHVDNVLEGGARRAGSRLKVTIQLVNVANSRDSTLWSETYDREFKDVMAVQEDIAQAVVRALKIHLGTGQTRLAGRATADTAAYTLYQKGIYYRRRLAPGDLLRAIDYFEQAIRHDSTYAPAYAWLCNAHWLRVVFDSRPALEEVPRARAYALKAVELDSTLAESHWALGEVLMGFDWDWAGAEREFRLARALDPGNVEARLVYSILLLTEHRFEDAASELERTLAADPLFSNAKMILGAMYIARRQPERALPYLREAVEILPMFGYAREQLGHAYLQVAKHEEAIPEFQRAAVTGGASDSAHLAYAYAVSNRRAEAMNILRALLASGNSRYIPPVNVAMVYVGLGDRDAALRWLERGYSEHDPVFATALSGWPAFDPLRTDPRFVTLMRRIKLTP